MDGIRIGIAGAGRMGQAIAGVLGEGSVLAGVWARDPDTAETRFPAGTRITDDVGALARDSDVLIDFSLPQGTVQVAAAVAEFDTPLVCGVSGLDDEHFAAVQRTADQVAVVFDRNMSQGVAVLTALVAQAARALGDGYTISIDETHHVHKIDAPSGTALKLGEAVADARGVHFEDVRWYEPERPLTDAPDGALRFIVERRGEVPGDHSVRFETPTESLTLGHSVTTRSVFAEGAVRAARWVARQPAGLYSMRDVLELS